MMREHIAYLLIALMIFNLIDVAASQRVCNRIELSGTTNEKGREGVYVLATEHGCGGKPSWRQETQIHPNHLLEIEHSSKNIKGVWVVSTKYCTNLAGLHTGNGNWDSPLDVPANTWKEHSNVNDSWVDSPMSLKCIEWEPEPCQFGSGPYCTGLSCKCGESTCDRQTGDCASGACGSGLPNPPNHAWHGEACQIGNVAYGKSATQTSSQSDDAARAVDGDAYTCTTVHPDPITGTASLQISLSSVHLVSEFTIYHSSDSQAGESGQITVGVSSEADLAADMTVCKTYERSTIGNSPVTVQCDNPVDGRYAIVRQNGGSTNPSLKLCEVVVTGHIYIDCSSCPGSCNEITGCDKCPVGRQLPDCKRSCNGHTYGESCKYPCGWCVDACDPVDGSCHCQNWWVGDQCKIFIESLQMEEQDIFMSSATSSVAIIRWKKIYNVPLGLHMYYKYEVQYKKQGSTVWQDGPSVFHDPDKAISLQEASLTNLRPNTRYDARIRSFRVVGAHLNATSETSAISFHTLCGEPNTVPLQVEHSTDNDDKLDFTISWEGISSEDIGCNILTAMTLMFRDQSSSDWEVVDVPITSTTHTVYDLPRNDYIFRLNLTNDAGFSTVSEETFSLPSPEEESSSDSNKALIIGAVVGAIVFLILVAVVVFLLLKLYRRKNRAAPSNPTGNTNVVVFTAGTNQQRVPSEGAVGINKELARKLEAARDSGNYEDVKVENSHYQRLTLPGKASMTPAISD